jgi:hypothetical protein
MRMQQLHTTTLSPLHTVAPSRARSPRAFEAQEIKIKCRIQLAMSSVFSLYAYDDV